MLYELLLEKANNHSYDISVKKGGIALGINQVLAGVFFSVAAVPGISVVGFMEQTNSTKKLPFLIGNILVVLVSLITPIMAFFTTLPTPVAYAAIFTVFSNLFGVGIKELNKIENKEKIYFTIGIPVFAGMGIMFVPNSAFLNLPITLTSFLSNGLVVGITLALIIEIYDLIGLKLKNLKKKRFSCNLDFTLKILLEHRSITNSSYEMKADFSIKLGLAFFILLIYSYSNCKYVSNIHIICKNIIIMIIYINVNY